MNRILFLFSFFFYSCSSLNQISDNSKVITAPKLPFLEPFEKSLDLSDCRIGKQNNSIITFYFLEPDYAIELDKIWKNLFIEFQEKLFSSKESKIIFQSISKDDPLYNDFCKKNNLDIIIKTSLELKNEIIKVNQTLIDSYTSLVYDNIYYEIEKSTNDLKKNLIEFYFNSNELHPLPYFSGKTLTFKKKPNLKLVQNIIQSNLHARINLYSSDPSVEVYFNKEAIGRPPIINYKIRSGPLKISFKKINSNTTREKYFNLRGGSTINIIDSEEGNFVNTTLYLWSYPSGLPIYRDGTSIGHTPLFLNSILPGTKFISINENNNNKIYIKQGMDNVLIKPKNLEDALKEPFIWDLKNSSTFQLDITCGICFINPIKNYIEEWVGIYTHPLEKGNIKISGNFYSLSERGEGEFIIGMYNDSIKQSIYFEEDMVWLFDYIKSNKSLNSYKSNINDENIYSFNIKINFKKELIYFYINNEKIYSSFFNNEGEWRLFIAAKGPIYNRINILKNISFTYD